MSTAPAYTSWRNNAHPQWWKDAGLRSMMTSLSVVYAASFTFGYDGTLLASLIILPQWSAYFGNPTGNTMGLIVFFIYAWFGFKETKGFTMEEVGYVFDGPDVVEEIRRNAGLRMASGGDKIAETEHDEDPSRGQDIVNRTAT